MVHSEISGTNRLRSALNDIDDSLSLIEDLQEGFCLVDEQENIIYANSAMSSLLGYRQEELESMNISSLIPKDQFNIVLFRTERRKKGLKGTYDTTVLRKDGSLRSVQINASPWINKNREYKGSFGLFLDITDKNELYQALKQNEEKYRATVEQSAENIYIYDFENQEIVESNRALQELLGYSDEELKKLKASDFIAHSPKNIKGKIEDVLEKGHAIIGDRIYKRKDGTLVNVEVSASHIAQGERSMLCVVSRDVTEMKRYQERLIEEKNRAEFYLDLIAHDMGNFLHGINNGLSILKVFEGDESRTDSTMTMLTDLAERSTRLYGDILTFSRIRDSDIELKEIELEPIVLKAINKLKVEFPNNDLNIDMAIENDLKIKAEPYLGDAFYHLLHNSIKAQNEETRIGLKAYSNKDKVIIEAWDNNGGIPEDMKKTIFQRFEQVNKRKHSGIGLTLVHMIIKKNGGDIQVKDHKVRGKVKGAKFIITF